MKRLFRFNVISAVDDENLLLLIAVLNGGNHLRTGRSRDRSGAAPASSEIIEINEINLFRSNDINLITVRCGSAHHDRFGKFGKFDPGILRGENERFFKFDFTVRSASAKDTVFSCARNTFCKIDGQLPFLGPFSVGITHDNVF